MSIESTEDWEGLKQVAKVARVTLDALTGRVHPGVMTAELDAEAARLFAAHGARSAPAMVYGFPGTVLISLNDEMVHGIPGPGAQRGVPTQNREGVLLLPDVHLEAVRVRERQRLPVHRQREVESGD
jgi:methionine aminopeptidase